MVPRCQTGKAGTHGQERDNDAKFLRSEWVLTTMVRSLNPIRWEVEGMDGFYAEPPEFLYITHGQCYVRSSYRKGGYSNNHLFLVPRCFFDMNCFKTQWRRKRQSFKSDWNKPARCPITLEGVSCSRLLPILHEVIKDVTCVGHTLMMLTTEGEMTFNQHGNVLPKSPDGVQGVRFKEQF